MPEHRLSLAQQIAQLDEAAPIDFDPDDLHAAGREPEEDQGEVAAGNAAAREHYVDVGPSAIRKLHDSISDPKYEGVRTSRKQLMDTDEDEELSEDDVGEAPLDHEGDEAESSGSEDEDDEEIPSESGSEDEDEPPPKSTKAFSSHVNDHSQDQSAPPAEDISSTLRKTREEDRKKGKAVSRQLTLWDSILDARIRLQKAVTAANRLPLPKDLSTYAAHPEVQTSLNKMFEEALSLSDTLFDFQETLLTTNDIIKSPPRKRRRTGEDQEQHVPDHDSAIREASEASSALEHAFHPYLVQTLTKWSAKVQAVAPSVLLPSTRNAFSRNQNQVKSAVQLVDEALADRTKLLGRTRIRRGGKARIGQVEQENQESSPDKEDPRVFDDTDFYQQLLRDVISTRTSDSSLLPGGAAYPNQRANKSKQKKKAVDTRASKGRKLRYEVHEKLQNFMVPVPMHAARGAWHEEQIDELFASLLGKGFEDAGGMDGVGGDVDADRKKLEEEAERAVQEGFRVFG
ncbi:TRAUB-domain-containing protein [Gloeophyllum trabeum ATCC 11539]|uniref:Protein BFR2 n=1 Tax=Gloeophyllum trabeum (strain ATCC 11539 / FP-39264 / Madison 617) TaxID=670483 RepID=S7Q8U9_GLOTA|nr:TRAUB-domain-containing protein [Gloeophyllum trabeum ATCC 11539]EPQ56406.1 TRAUB-domain-containing protein [Gloeophyllum trabeum ATCC 11539]